MLQLLLLELVMKIVKNFKHCSRNIPELTKNSRHKISFYEKNVSHENLFNFVEKNCIKIANKLFFPSMKFYKSIAFDNLELNNKFFL